RERDRKSRSEVKLVGRLARNSPQTAKGKNKMPLPARHPLGRPSCSAIANRRTQIWTLEKETRLQHKRIGRSYRRLGSTKIDYRLLDVEMLQSLGQRQKSAGRTRSRSALRPRNLNKTITNQRSPTTCRSRRS